MVLWSCLIDLLVLTYNASLWMYSVARKKLLPTNMKIEVPPSRTSLTTVLICLYVPSDDT